MIPYGDITATSVATFAIMNPDELFSTRVAAVPAALSSTITPFVESPKHANEEAFVQAIKKLAEMVNARRDDFLTHYENRVNLRDAVANVNACIQKKLKPETREQKL